MVSTTTAPIENKIKNAVDKYAERFKTSAKNHAEIRGFSLNKATAKQRQVKEAEQVTYLKIINL